MIIKSDRPKYWVAWVIVAAFAALFALTLKSGLADARAAEAVSAQQLKKVKYSDVSRYDPFIFRKQWVPLPKKTGLRVPFNKTRVEPAMEFVVGVGKWRVAFLRGGAETARASFEVTEAMNSRAVIDVPQAALGGYDAISLTQTVGRAAWLSYVSPIGSRADATVNNPDPPRPWGLVSDPGPHDIYGAVGYFIGDDGAEMTIRAQSLSELDIYLLAVVTDKGKRVATFPEGTRLETVNTSELWLNDFKAARTKQPYDVAKLVLQYRYIDEDGTVNENEVKESIVNPFPPYDDALHNATEIRETDNLGGFDFVAQAEDGVVTFVGDVIRLDRRLFVPQGKRLVLSAGQTIELTNEASIFCRSAIQVQGTEDAPVVICSPDGTGHGLVVLGGNANGGRSYVDYLTCDGLGEVHSGAYHLTGCVTFYESDVTIRNSRFLNNRSEDGLNTVRSDVRIENSLFFNTFSDSYDADFCTVYVGGCVFEQSGNDGVDVSTSTVRVENCVFRDMHDKACSIGEASTAYIENIDVAGAQAVVGAKDTSKVTAKHLRGKDVLFGYLAYQKKPEFGHSTAYIEDFALTGKTDFDYMIEAGEAYYLDGKQKLPRSKKKEALLVQKIINEEPIR